MSYRPLKVRFCGDCGRMILVAFEFCPYCGSPVPPGAEGRGDRPVDASSESPYAPESPGRASPVPRDGPESRELLDRLIRELEVLDAEVEDWAGVKDGRDP